jgi:hypothetical protein
VAPFDPSFANQPSGGRGEVVATFDDYTTAEAAVDRLSDSGFPVQYAEIVGRDLSLVEKVTGRLTPARAAGAGAATGAWWGLFIGLLVGWFTTGSEWIGLVVGGLLIGAVWGAVFGFVAQWATHGRRDFSSARGIIAGRYDVNVPQELADRARQLIGS